MSWFNDFQGESRGERVMRVIDPRAFEESDKADRSKRLASAKRDVEYANKLVSDEAFRDYAYSIMDEFGYFGINRELTPFEQGQQSAIREAIDSLVALAHDGGEEFLRTAAEKYATRLVAANKHHMNEE